MLSLFLHVSLFSPSRCSVALLDQNINAPDGSPHLLGTHLAEQLKQQDFRGVTCILTGSSAHAINEIRQCAGVDLAMPKSMSLVEQQSLIQAALERENTNKFGTAQLTGKECELVFSSGFKAHNASASSDGVGLDSVTRAVEAAGGSAQLRCTSSHTIFRVQLPAEVAAGVVEVAEGGSKTSGTVAELTEAADIKMADQPSATAMPGPGIPIKQRLDPELAPTPAAGPILHTPADPSNTMPTAEPTSTAESILPAAEPLVCIGIDDSCGPRALQQAMFEHILKADMSRSISIGATKGEQTAFIDMALGRLDIQMQEVAPELQRHAE